MTEPRITYVKDDNGVEWLDEICSNAGAYMEAMDDDEWFLSFQNLDGTEYCAWIKGRVTMVEERPAPDRPMTDLRAVTVQEALTVAASLEAWAEALRAGRTIEPSIMGLSDMARSLRALAEGERG